MPGTEPTVAGVKDDLPTPGHTQPSETDAPLSVAAVARLLGVAPATLRTWARRYALGPSHHEVGTHRRYSPDDVSRLETMRRLTLRGVPAAEAALIAARSGRSRDGTGDGPGAGGLAGVPTVLSGAEVSGAEVSGADVSGAEVSGADVSGAEVSGADVSGAEVADADAAITGGGASHMRAPESAAGPTRADAASSAATAESAHSPRSGPVARTEGALTPDTTVPRRRDRPGTDAGSTSATTTQPGHAPEPATTEPATTEPATTTGAGASEPRPADGTVDRLPRASSGGRRYQHTRLVAAAYALDGPGIVTAVRESLDRRGVVVTWEELCAPALRAIGDRWERTGLGVDAEHLTSECMIAVLGAYVHRGLSVGNGRPVNSRPVVLACTPDELHSLPLNVVSAALAERRIASRVLGARVPRNALLRAVSRSAPGAVLLWAHNAGSGEAGQVEGIPLSRHGPLIALGGPGWPVTIEVLRRRVVRVEDLPEAVNTLASAAGA